MTLQLRKAIRVEAAKHGLTRKQADELDELINLTLVEAIRNSRRVTSESIS